MSSEVNVNIGIESVRIGISTRCQPYHRIGTYRYQVPNFQILVGLTSAFGSRYNTDTILPDANIPSLIKIFKCQKNELTKTLNVIKPGGLDVETNQDRDRDRP